jgi:hypothetical protein
MNMGKQKHQKYGWENIRWQDLDNGSDEGQASDSAQE